MKSILTSEFWHDGRGPELQRVVWAHQGRILQAVEYLNPDWSDIVADLWHLRFQRVQVVQITPEEVINYEVSSTSAAGTKAAAFDLGRSEWLRSFSPRHLDQCKHLRLMFYDQLFDLICEGVISGRGPVAVGSQNLWTPEG